MRACQLMLPREKKKIYIFGMIHVRNEYVDYVDVILLYFVIINILYYCLIYVNANGRTVLCNGLVNTFFLKSLLI